MESLSRHAQWLASNVQAIRLEAFAMLPVLHQFGSKIFFIEDETNLTDQYIAYFQAQLLASLIPNDGLKSVAKNLQGLQAMNLVFFHSDESFGSLSFTVICF